MPVYAALSHTAAEALVDVLWVIESSGADWDSPVVTPLAGRVFVDADQLRGRKPRGQATLRPAAAPCCGTQTRRSNSPCGHRPDRRARGRLRPQPLGPPAIPTGQPWKLFGEGTPPVRDDRAGEPADTQTASDPADPTGRISGKSRVGAVDPPCPAAMEDAVAM